MDYGEWFDNEREQREIDRMKRRVVLALEFAKPEYEGFTPETLYHLNRIADERTDWEAMMRSVPPCTCAWCKRAVR